jgi:hypothetical protein
MIGHDVDERAPAIGAALVKKNLSTPGCLSDCATSSDPVTAMIR